MPRDSLQKREPVFCCMSSSFDYYALTVVIVYATVDLEYVQTAAHPDIIVLSILSWIKHFLNYTMT